MPIKGSVQNAAPLPGLQKKQDVLCSGFFFDFEICHKMFISKKEGSLYYQPKQSQIPRHPVIPPEVNGVLGMCLGGPNPFQEVFGCLGSFLSKKKRTRKKTADPQDFETNKVCSLANAAKEFFFWTGAILHFSGPPSWNPIIGEKNA